MKGTAKLAYTSRHSTLVPYSGSIWSSDLDRRENNERESRAQHLGVGGHPETNLLMVMIPIAIPNIVAMIRIIFMPPSCSWRRASRVRMRCS